MLGRLNLTHENYLNLFLIYEEFAYGISRTCNTYATRFPEKQKPSKKLHRYFGSERVKAPKKNQTSNISEKYTNANTIK